MSLKIVLAVAAGGAVGAVGRFLITNGLGHWLGQGFPYGTMIVNVAGSFLLGALIGLSALIWSPSPEFRAFLTVGCLGAFTTFSVYSFDAVTLWQRGDLLASTVYVGGSVILGISGFLAGLAIVRSVWA